MIEPLDTSRGQISSCAIALAIFLLTPSSMASAATVTFSYTGAEQTWIVPPGVTSATFDLYGAQGGTTFSADFGSGGLGGRATATLAVTPGETIEIRVGGQGTNVGGYNGGGKPGAGSYTAGGGGATDVRQGGTSLADRVLVAAGGGGSGACLGAAGSPSSGGAGGGLVGGDALPTDPGASCTELTKSGKGGTQAAGGAGGDGAGAGTLGQGGDAEPSVSLFHGGGGGGYYGGGGGSNHSGGGGGSAFGPSGTGFETGVRTGDGLVTITFDFRLDVTTDGAGSGFVTSSPAGIDCETGSGSHPDCTAPFSDSAPVTLSASPTASSVFLGWGGECSGTAGCMVTMDQARSVTATFGLLDFGDAADPTFPTLLASNGARHLLGSGVYLGACVDSELDGQPSGDADADDLTGSPATIGACAVPGDDEDGVVFTGQILAGTSATVDVTASAGCTLSAWLDFDGDGDWTDAGEDLFPGGTALAPGVSHLTFAVPAGALSGSHTARFRCTTAGAVSFTGEAPDGEVEDYLVDVFRSPAKLTVTKTGALLVDGNGNGRIDPGDTVGYTVVITNGGDAPALSVIFTDAPDPNTALINGSVTTTGGNVAIGNTMGDTSVNVDVGHLSGGGSVTITYSVTLADPLSPNVSTITNQGLVSADNVTDAVTDDPAMAGGSDPTILAVTGSPIVKIPTLDAIGLAIFAALLAATGLLMRRP